MRTINASRTAGTTPAVVFVDHTRWGTFTQLAAFVRRSGFRTVRVTTERRTWYDRLIDRLVFSNAIYVDEAGLSDLSGLLTGESVADVQVTEYVCHQVATGDLTGLDPGVARSLVVRGRLLDKFVMGEMASARNVRTPEKLAADAVTPQKAAVDLGFPLVLKARVGASGDRVRIVGDAAQLEEALAELGPDLSQLFYERYIDGDCIDYSAIADESVAVQEVVTRTLAAGDGTLPPSEIEILDDPVLIGFGRHALEQLEVAGIAHMDTVRDADGTYWLLDLNLRAWGSMFSCMAAGVDFGSGYLYAIGLRTEKPDVWTGRPGVFKVFPSVVEEQIRLGRVAGTCAAFLRHSPVFLKWLGVRYWIAQAAVSAVGLAGTLTQRRARAR